MSEVISLSAHKAVSSKMRIGLLRLTDGAPVVVAHEFGFFAEEGLEVELVCEPSWANIADKLIYGFLDAAVIVPPLAFAVQARIAWRGPASSSLIRSALAVIPSRSPAGLAEVKDLAARKISPQSKLWLHVARAEHDALGIVHAYSTHNLLLRYWLATAGIEAGKDVKLAVVHGTRCRGAEFRSNHRLLRWRPLGRSRAACGHGHDHCDLARHLAERAGEGLCRARPLGRGSAPICRWCDARFAPCSEVLRSSGECLLHRYTAAVLSRRKYLDVDPHAILRQACQAGRRPPGSRRDRGCIFFGGGATFPWRSHGLWFLSEMRRWGLVGRELGSARTGGTRLPAGPLPSRSRTAGRASAHTGLEARRRRMARPGRLRQSRQRIVRPTASATERCSTLMRCRPGQTRDECAAQSVSESARAWAKQARCQRHGKQIWLFRICLQSN